jgi:predicted GNAT superfamily acetyltransferase
MRVPGRQGGVVTEALADEEGGAATTDVGVEIRLLDTTADVQRLAQLFNQVWGTSTEVVGIELIRAIGHAGGYVAGAYAGDQLIGGSMGFLARHLDQPALHSHLTGILPGVRHTGLGRLMKRHQRAWAAARQLVWVTWTFDPLVRRNAWFNLGVLGAEVHEYLVDFYGPIDDSINAGDESDRLLVAWPVDDGPRPPRPSPETFTVPTPEDIVVLRRTSPAEAEAWRRRVRRELATPMENGAHIVEFTRAGDYVVAPGRAS